ncbi:hypothetical protein KSU1_C0677 [Candidatus Jettenia caeni]|uniref:Uncharacterized protein n=1 Tax=Candidatus Jettenia caeni TaxID=247490 RepID=I3IKM8_9BACT|nr:hypothetical protein KSU1_C0677 [Candidatus Jettenia caeni]
MNVLKRQGLGRSVKKEEIQELLILFPLSETKEIPTFPPFLNLSLPTSQRDKFE